MSIPSSVCMLIGRLCVCAIFILAGISKFAHFGPSVQEVASKGLPIASILLIIAAIVEILGGLSLLFGYKTRFWATILMLYLIPVTYFFHNFWSADEAHRQLQMIEFLKNLAIFGAYGCSLVSAQASLASMEPLAKATSKNTKLIRQRQLLKGLDCSVFNFAFTI